MPRGGDGRVGSPKPFSVFGVGGGGSEVTPPNPLSLYPRIESPWLRFTKELLTYEQINECLLITN